MTDKATSNPIEASTPKTIKARVGQVVQVGVKVDGNARPTITPPDGPRLFTARDASGAWVSSWVPTAPGSHSITAGVGDTSVTFTVNAHEE